MRPGSVVANIASGELNDEHALADPLGSGRLAEARIAVFAIEPVCADDLLFAVSDVVLTTHVSWLTLQTLERSISVITENRRRLRNSEQLLNRH